MLWSSSRLTFGLGPVLVALALRSVSAEISSQPSSKLHGGGSVDPSTKAAAQAEKAWEAERGFLIPPILRPNYGEHLCTSSCANIYLL